MANYAWTELSKGYQVQGVLLLSELIAMSEEMEEKEMGVEEKEMFSSSYP